MVLQVRVLRVARNIPQWVMAQRVGVDTQRWREIELGRKEASQAVAIKAAKVLGVSIETLFEPVELESGRTESDGVELKRSYPSPVSKDDIEVEIYPDFRGGGLSASIDGEVKEWKNGEWVVR